MRKIIGLTIATCLGFFGALFIYIAFFEKDLPKSVPFALLCLGIGCLSFAVIIGLLSNIIDLLEHKNNPPPMSKGKTHYASYEAPHEGDNTAYWGDPICGQSSENLTQYEDDVTCNNCVRLINLSEKRKKIVSLLRMAGFEQTEETSRDYANDYCCVCLDYQKEGETVIVNSHGGIMEQLPTNYYAILGWLLKSRMASIKILDHP